MLKFGLGRVENIVEKGENDGFQHFLLFPQCFQKASFSGSLKVGIVWERVNCLPHNPDFQLPVVKHLFKALWEKKKVLLTSIFSFSHYVFNPMNDKNHHILSHFILLSASALNLDQPRILSFGKEAKVLSSGKLLNII